MTDIMVNNLLMVAPREYDEKEQQQLHLFEAYAVWWYPLKIWVKKNEMSP